MERQEAERYLELVKDIVANSNKTLFSGTKMIVIGVVVLLIPLINRLLGMLLSYFSWGQYSLLLIPVIYIAMYWLIIYLLEIAYHKATKGERTRFKVVHPAVIEVFSLSKIFYTVILGTIFVFIAIGAGALVFPIIYIFLGILFNFYGRFSTQVVKYLSWSYVVFGFIFAFLSQYQIPHLWIAFSTYLGISFVIMGISLHRVVAGHPEI